MLGTCRSDRDGGEASRGREITEGSRLDPLSFSSDRPNYHQEPLRPNHEYGHRRRVYSIDRAGFYVPKIQPWKDWQPENVIATLFILAESGPLLQRERSIDPVSLYEFKLTADHTLTISTRHPEVETTWLELAES